MPTRSKTRIYLAVISRIHAIRPRHEKSGEPLLADPDPGAKSTKSVKVDIATQRGDSSKHLLTRILPEMKWMPLVPASIVVEHAATKPNDEEVRAAIKRERVLPPRSSPGFGLGENVFGGPDPKPSKWTDSGWKEELTVAGLPDDSDYVAGFQITYGDSPDPAQDPLAPYYQSIPYSSAVLLRMDYVLVAQQASITS